MECSLLSLGLVNKRDVAGKCVSERLGMMESLGKLAGGAQGEWQSSLPPIK